MTAKQRTSITIMGAGPGDPMLLTLEAKKVLQKADVIYSSKDTALPDGCKTKTRPLTLAGLPAIRARISKDTARSTVFFVSGDPGFFSISKHLLSAFKDLPVRVVPGISSLQYLCARAGIAWEGTATVSLHGTNRPIWPSEPGKSIFVITSSADDLSKVARKLPGRQAIVGADLSTENEMLVKLSDTKELIELARDDRIKKTRLLAVLVMGPAKRMVKGAEPRTAHSGSATSANEKNSDKVLYGIGLGPGETGLLTIKGERALRDADLIFYPRSQKLKRSIAKNMLSEIGGLDPKKQRPLLFPMSDDKAVLMDHWRKAAACIHRAFNKHDVIAFVTLGDPSIYSTHAYLRKEFRKLAPDITLTTIPGITAASAIAARSETSLVEAREELQIIPFRGKQDLERALSGGDTTVLYKFGRHLALLPLLIEHYSEFVLALDAGHEKGRLITDKAEALKLAISGQTYLATLILKGPKKKGRSR